MKGPVPINSRTHVVSPPAVRSSMTTYSTSQQPRSGNENALRLCGSVQRSW